MMAAHVTAHVYARCTSYQQSRSAHAQRVGLTPRLHADRALGRAAGVALAGRARVCTTTTAGGFGVNTNPQKKVKIDKAVSEEVAPCPCGSGNPYGDCCEPYHKGKRYPADPETLMRSRYSGFCKSQLKYLVDTTHPEHVEKVDKTDDQLKDDYNLSCKNISYEGLKVLETREGETEDEAFVRFRIWYKFVADFQGKRGGKVRKATEKSDRKTNTELSRFKLVKGKWLFLEEVESDNTSFRLGDTADESSDVLLKAKDGVNKAMSLAAQARSQFGFKK